MAGIDRSSWPQVQALQDVGRQFYQRGWSLGTSSNYSVVLTHNPLQLLLTASGKDKGRLSPADFVVVDDAGRALDATDPKPSAETLLHVVVAQQTKANAILHTHSVWGTLLSDHFFSIGAVEFEGFEMLKGLSGINTHETHYRLQIVENSQDIARMARELAPRFTATHAPLRHGFLIRRHGLYTWGRDLDEARRHTEIFEFLLEVTGRRLTLAK